MILIFNLKNKIAPKAVNIKGGKVKINNRL